MSQPESLSVNNLLPAPPIDTYLFMAKFAVRGRFKV